MNISWVKTVPDISWGPSAVPGTNGDETEEKVVSSLGTRRVISSRWAMKRGIQSQYNRFTHCRM